MSEGAAYRDFALRLADAAGAVVRKYYRATLTVESKADAINQEAIKAFQDHKAKVVSLSDADYQAWIEVAKKTSYAQFAKDVPNGQKLIDEALAVK